MSRPGRVYSMRMPKSVVVLVVGFGMSVCGLLGFVAGGGGVVGGFRSGGVSFADIVERVNPAVVNISVVETGNVHEDVEDAPDLDVPQRGEGSGFIVDPTGFILTNSHLVAGSSAIRVRFADKRELAGRLVGTDPNTDLALVKVDSSGLPTVVLGDSDRLRVGDWVCAIGNPYSYDHTVTAGVVSSKGRKIFNASFDAYIQTDAAINPGNSGGPLINDRGEAVGINAAVSMEGQGIGFAIPINVAREIMGQLRSTGRVSRGYLGIQLEEIEPDMQKLLGLKDPRGALVLDVVKGSAGEAAGLERYDVITAISGEAIDDGDRLVHVVAGKAPGSSVSLDVVRDGRKLSLNAKLDERHDEPSPSPADEAAKGEASPGPRGDALGIVPAELTRKVRRESQIPPDRSGVVVDEVVGLAPGLDDLAEGDLIVEVNRRATPDLSTYRKVVASLKKGDVAWLYVYRPRPRATFLVKAEVGSPS
jgi:serine protease Do